MSRYSVGLLILVASLVALAEGRPVTSGSSSSSSTAGTIARGALIAIIVCVVVGVILCLVCTFCLVRIMRRRKAAKVVGGGAVPMTTGEKPIDNTHGYTGGAPNNGYPGPGNAAHHDEYNGQPPAYGGQNNYTSHQNEYNSSYNTGQQQQSFAPPSGPPPMGMPMPNANY